MKQLEYEILKIYIKKINKFLEYEKRNFMNRRIRRKCNKCGQRRTGKTYCKRWNTTNMKYQTSFFNVMIPAI